MHGPCGDLNPKNSCMSANVTTQDHSVRRRPKVMIPILTIEGAKMAEKLQFEIIIWTIDGLFHTILIYRLNMIVMLMWKFVLLSRLLNICTNMCTRGMIGFASLLVLMINQLLLTIT